LTLRSYLRAQHKDGEGGGGGGEKKERNVCQKVLKANGRNSKAEREYCTPGGEVEGKQVSEKKRAKPKSTFPGGGGGRRDRWGGRGVGSHPTKKTRKDFPTASPKPVCF